jgi:malate synthase
MKEKLHRKISIKEFFQNFSRNRRNQKGNWVCNPLPEDLLDRRVEITGPVDRKMIINALNCGASTFMADFEDSNSPTWKNCMEGQINLSDAINRRIDFTNEQGKSYQLNEEMAVLLVRPRGLHLNEKHIEINDEQTSASLIDFGIYFSET